MTSIHAGARVSAWIFGCAAPATRFTTTSDRCVCGITKGFGLFGRDEQSNSTSEGIVFVEGVVLVHGSHFSLAVIAVTDD
jgi:hypothetical protein